MQMEVLTIANKIIITIDEIRKQKKKCLQLLNGSAIASNIASCIWLLSLLAKGAPVIAAQFAEFTSCWKMWQRVQRTSC